MNTVARLAKHGSRLCQSGLQSPALLGGEASRLRLGGVATSTGRGFAAGGHGHGDTVTYGGLLCISQQGGMWFWPKVSAVSCVLLVHVPFMFYRFWQPFSVLMLLPFGIFWFGHAYHFEHEGPDDEEGGGHSHGGHGHH